jgi:hypothetical protein
MKFFKTIIFIFLSMLLLSGCWYYSFTEKPYPDIKSVFIAPFGNETDVYDISPSVTEQLNSKLQGGGLLEVTSRNLAQSAIEGTILAYEKQAYSYTSGEEPLEFQVRIRAKVAFTKTGESKPLWEATLEGFSTFPADESTKDETTARQEAASMLVERILDRLRQG